MAILGGLVDERIQRQGDEVHEHDLQHWSHSAKSGPNAHPGNGRLADRCIPNTRSSVLLCEIPGRSEGPAYRDILAKQVDRGVPGHFLIECPANSLDEAVGLHRSVPLSGRSRISMDMGHDLGDVWHGGRARTLHDRDQLALYFGLDGVEHVPVHALPL